MQADMNGIELINAIRKRGVDVPIVLHASQGNRPLERLLAAAKGDNIFFEKPADMNALAEFLEQKKKSMNSAGR